MKQDIREMVYRGGGAGQTGLQNVSESDNRSVGELLRVLEVVFFEKPLWHQAVIYHRLVEDNCPEIIIDKRIKKGGKVAKNRQQKNKISPIARALLDTFVVSQLTCSPHKRSLL